MRRGGPSWSGARAEAHSPRPKLDVIDAKIDRRADLNPALIDSEAPRALRRTPADRRLLARTGSSVPDDAAGRLECNRVPLTEMSAAELCRSLLVDVEAF